MQAHVLDIRVVAPHAEHGVVVELVDLESRRQVQRPQIDALGVEDRPPLRIIAVHAITLDPKIADAVDVKRRVGGQHGRELLCCDDPLPRAPLLVRPRVFELLLLPPLDVVGLDWRVGLEQSNDAPERPIHNVTANLERLAAADPEHIVTNDVPNLAAERRRVVMMPLPTCVRYS